MDDNINFDLNNKTENVENTVKSDNVEEILKDVENEIIIKTKDVERSSEPLKITDISTGGGFNPRCFFSSKMPRIPLNKLIQRI